MSTSGIYKNQVIIIICMSRSTNFGQDDFARLIFLDLYYFFLCYTSLPL